MAALYEAANLLQATELARGQTSGSIADDSEIAALLLDGRQNYDLLACLEPAGWHGKKKKSGMLELVDRLMLRFKAGEPPKLEITGVLDKKRAGRDLTVEKMIHGMESIKNWKAPGGGAPATYGPNRHHGLNGTRLERAEKGKLVPVTGFVLYKPWF